MRRSSSASRSISASLRPASRPASRSRAFASRISGVRSTSAAAIASSAAFLIPEGSAASCAAARLAARQVSATDVAVTAMVALNRLREHEVVPVDRLLGGPRQPLADVGRLQPPDPPELDRRVVADPLADQLPVECDLNRVAGIEIPRHLYHPDGQPARP